MASLHGALALSQHGGDQQGGAARRAQRKQPCQPVGGCCHQQRLQGTGSERRDDVAAPAPADRLCMRCLACSVLSRWSCTSSLLASIRRQPEDSICWQGKGSSMVTRQGGEGTQAGGKLGGHTAHAHLPGDARSWRRHCAAVACLGQQDLQAGVHRGRALARWLLIIQQLQGRQLQNVGCAGR